MSAPTWGGAQPPFTSYHQPQYATQTEVPSHISPAYNSVQARRGGFEQPYSFHQLSDNLPSTVQSSPSQATSSPAPPSKEKFPISCREYVARAYLAQNTIPGISREDLDKKLKETIRLATTEDRLWSEDWDNIDLPQVMIQKERAALKMTVTNPVLGPPFNGQAAANGMQSKKRKSMENGDENVDASNTTPPWRTANNGNALQDRLSYPVQQTRQQRFQDDSSPKANSKFQKNLEKRQRRFDGGYKSAYKSPSPEASAGPVVGRCQILEKKYFRLTAAPDPDKVRPLHILEKALDVLKQKWRKEGNYNYICDQFKSMRQDLTVQRIKNEFTVSVYEIHARIALEKGDLGEYNQCQTQLRALYAQNIAGKDVEFKAYRILYFIHTCNRTALNDVLADLTTAEKREPAIKHALDVRSALALGNYHKFFRLYLDTPNMGAYLMDMFVTRERLAALSNICKAYKPTVPLRFIAEELGFEGDNEAYNFIVDINPDLIQEKSVNGEDVLVFLTGMAGATFETAKTEAFRKVDLKGQI